MAVRRAGRRTTASTRAAAGFTLLEMLVAIAIFALLAAAGYAALQAMLDARARVAGEMDRLQHLQSAFMLFERDLDQALPRPVRAPDGGLRDAIAGAPLHATAGATPDATAGVLLELTRGGWDNPAGLPRSTLQRVRWVVDGAVLRRDASAVLDGAAPMASGRVLLDGVEGATLRFLDGGRRWHERWPVPGERALLAVELVLDVKGFGRLRRLFPVSPGAGA